MNGQIRRSAVALAATAMVLLLLSPLFAAQKKWAVVVSAGSKLQDVSLADLQKLYKGTQKAWPDGRNFVLVVQHPDSPEIKSVLDKLSGVTAVDTKTPAAKPIETRPALKVVDSDEELMRVVGSTPGAIGIMDVYGINSAVKVLRVDGKLPFDPGYTLRGN